MPKRIQLRRTKGWRMPVGAMKVDRSTNYGNSFKVGERYFYRGWHRIEDTAKAVALFRERELKLIATKYLAELRGKDLACWCKLCPAHQDGKPFGVECRDCAPCHADALGDVVNRPVRSAS